MADPVESVGLLGGGALAMKVFDFLLGRFGRSTDKLQERVDFALEDHKKRLHALEAVTPTLASVEKLGLLAERVARLEALVEQLLKERRT